MAGVHSRFPTARDAGTGFPLVLETSGGSVSGETVGEFLISVLRCIDEAGAWGNLEIPFRTSGENILLAYSPQHRTGRKFVAFRCYKPARREAVVYVNTNHPRFFGLRQGARLLEAAGIQVLKVT